MRKITLLLVLLTYTLFGYNYDNILLKAQAKIYPKLLLMDKDISQEVINNTLIFTIIYHKSDYNKAIDLQRFIQKNIGKKILKYDLKIKLKEFSENFYSDFSNGYFFLQGDKDKIKEICDIAKKRNIPTFSYEYTDLFNHVLISLLIKNKSIIYLNKTQHKAYHIRFINSFYQIVRFVYEK